MKHKRALSPAAVRLRAAWRQAGHTRNSLAEILGCSRPTATRYYRDPGLLTARQLAIIAKALDKSASEVHDMIVN